MTIMGLFRDFQQHRDAGEKTGSSSFQIDQRAWATISQAPPVGPCLYIGCGDCGQRGHYSHEQHLWGESIVSVHSHWLARRKGSPLLLLSRSIQPGYIMQRQSELEDTKQAMYLTTSNEKTPTPKDH